MTDISRDELLDLLQERILEAFGEPNLDGTFAALCPHCQAHHALATIISLYAERDEDDDEPDADEIAGRVTGPRLH